jgi:hypothetical protein
LHLKRINREDSPVIKDYVKRKLRRRHFERTILPGLAQELLTNIYTEKNRLKPPTCIYDVFDALENKLPTFFTRPTWLQPYIDVLNDSIINGTINRVTFSAPPRHSKSQTALVSLVFACMIKENLDHAYITYNQSKAKEEKRKFTNLLDELGIEYLARDSMVYVKPLNGGKRSSVRFTSIEGKITGTNLTGILFIDDCVGSMEEAISINRQTLIREFYDRQVITRGNKFSIIIMNTRWTTNDLIGLLIERGYNNIRIPAICDEVLDPINRRIGEALWSSNYSVESLEKIKIEIGEYAFSAMYQGLPIIQGSTPIKTIDKYFEGFETNDVIYSYGMDLAYSGKQKSDYCAIVCIETERKTGYSHITRAFRKQTLYRDFLEDVKLFTKFQPGNIYFCAGGFEEETSGEDFKKAFGGRMVITKATKNKYTRLSQSGAIIAFNEGWLLMPKIQNKELEILEDQLLSFSGIDLGPGTDDYVDALAAAYNSVKHIRIGKQKKNSNILSGVPEYKKEQVIENKRIKVREERKVSNRRERGV